MNSTTLAPGEQRPVVVAAPERLAFRPREIANLYGLSHQFVYAEIYAGRLKAVRKGRAVLIMATALEEWLAVDAA